MNKSMEYEVRKRVDVEYDEDILRLAGIEAAKLGISRRQYLSKCVTTIILMTKAGVLDLDPFNMNVKIKSREPYKVEEI